MAAPHGVAGQFGFKSESTPGTAVTVDTFPPGFLNESVTAAPARIESQAIRAGRLLGSGAWKAGAVEPSGAVNLELWDDDLAALLKHCFGAVSTSGSGPYTHTYTPGDLTGDSFTAQFGLQAFCKVVQGLNHSPQPRHFRRRGFLRRNIPCRRL